MLQFQAPHPCEDMRRNKGQASWDCLFLESEDKAFLEALEQIPQMLQGLELGCMMTPQWKGS